MEKFKEKYTDNIICSELGSNVNGELYTKEICDMAVQFVKCRVFVPENVAFPDIVEVDHAPVETGKPINVKVTFDLEPKLELFKVQASSVLEVSEPQLSGKSITFTVTPTDKSVNNYTNVLMVYDRYYTRGFNIDELLKSQAPVPPKPVVPKSQIGALTLSVPEVHIGYEFLLGMSFTGSIDDPSEIKVEADPALTEVTPLSLHNVGMRGVMRFKAPKEAGDYPIVVKKADEEFGLVIYVRVTGVAPEEEVSADYNVASVTADPVDVKVSQESKVEVEFVEKKAPEEPVVKSKRK